MEQLPTKEQVYQIWIEALESGEYAQIKHRLHTDEGFCCLGVLEDVYNKIFHPSLKWRLRSEVASSMTMTRSGAKYRNIYELSKKIQKFMGIEGSPRINYKGDERGLVELNDTEGLSFKEIADLLRKNPIIKSKTIC